MKLRATNATRILRLVPALLQMIWGPALCMAMLNTHTQPRTGIARAAQTPDPISAFYAGILNPIRPAGTWSHERSGTATPGIAAGQNRASLPREHIFQLPWATGTGVQNPARSLAFFPWNTHHEPSLNAVFNTLYTVNKSSGIANRRIPKLMPSYWGSLSLPSPGYTTSPRTDFTRRSEDLAKLGGAFGKVPIADLVKANIFRLVSLASW